MVNITHKNYSLRKAIAAAEVTVSLKETIAAIENRKVPKGDIFEFARAAALLAIKKTSDVIPDCHPLPIEFAAITYTVNEMSVSINVEVHTIYKTGVEVEAMHGASVAALVMYDMLKPIDKGVEIKNIRLVSKQGGKSDNQNTHVNLSAAVIVCSDTVSKGEKQETAGKAAIKALEAHSLSGIEYSIIPDEIDDIQNIVRDHKQRGTNLLLFTGGTGLSHRDVTPDAVSPLIDTFIPGIMETIRSYGQQRTAFSMLSRGVAGFAGDTLVITLPGSQKGVEESLQAILPQIFHVFAVRKNLPH